MTDPTTVVVKVGTSSITHGGGAIDDRALLKLSAEIAAARRQGARVVLVLSGAIAAGLPALSFEERPTDIVTLQAIAAVGQPRLAERLGAILASHGLVAGQVLLTPYDFAHRNQYLHARRTLERLIELGVVPVVNENDTIADDEIRYGDNDRLAALVSHLVAADLLILLTDQSGLFTADPRRDDSASLIEEIVEVDAALEAVAGGSGSSRGSGGMAGKLAAAKIASWSGVRTVIAAAAEPNVIAAAIDGEPVGTSFRARPTRLPARKLWIAFARGAEGHVLVDEGARAALVDGGRSLLPAGVREVRGTFAADAAVEVCELDGTAFAKGIARIGADMLREVAGRHTTDLPAGVPDEVVHRDDLVVLP